MSLSFDLTFEPAHGSGVLVAPGVVRVTAPNASHFTFHGTNSYVIGTDTVAVIDPGPDDDDQLRTLLDVIGGRPVSHILISHTHRDHSPLAERLKAATGAPTLAEGPHRASRPVRDGEGVRLDAGGDTDFVPDRTFGDGELIEGDGFQLRTVLTPGHAANHACFELVGTGILFSADHVMGWATTVVAPPDGAMSDYMASLDKLVLRDDRVYLPGHGGPVTNPAAFVRGLRAHRKMRERAIIERLRQGDRTIPEMVAVMYRDVDPRLHPAAALSVLAHLEDLVERGIAIADGPPSLASAYAPA